MLNITTGHNIKEHRLKRGWTQEKLGELLSVSHQVISKWENAITLPDIQMLYNLSQLFGVTLDELCGAMIENVYSLYPLDEKAEFTSLNKGWRSISCELQAHPFSTDLLLYALKYLRLMHDRIETDEQKETVNSQIFTIARRILDVSTDDDSRSVAHYSLAVYYDEQVDRRRGNVDDRKNARLAKEHADRVLYKDMHSSYYCSFGTATISEDLDARKRFFVEAIEYAERGAENLLRTFRLMKNADRRSGFTEKTIANYLEKSQQLKAELKVE